MPHILEDRILESTTSIGTGVLTLAAALTGFRRFSAVCAVNDTFPYFIEAIDSLGAPTGDYEYGIGTYSAADQITRTRVLGSSNGGALVNFAAGSKNVGIGMTRQEVDYRARPGFRNKLINGNFKINQRVAASGSTVYAAGAYVMDRWKAGAAGCTLSWATSGNDVVVTITDGSLMQVVEDLNVEGGVYALSNQGTATARIAVNGAATAGAYAAAATNAPLLSASATALQTMTVEFSTGTLDRVQLEPGTVATPFERRQYGVELALCQRYYEKSFALATAPVQNSGTLVGSFRGVQVVGAAATQVACGTLSFKVTKRAAPSIITFNPSAANASARNGQRAQDWGNGAASVIVSEMGIAFAGYSSSAASAAGDDFSIHWTADSEL